MQVCRLVSGRLMHRIIAIFNVLSYRLWQEYYYCGYWYIAGGKLEYNVHS